MMTDAYGGSRQSTQSDAYGRFRILRHFSVFLPLIPDRRGARATSLVDGADYRDLCTLEKLGDLFTC